MEPASTIISVLGGPSAVARMLNVHRTRVSNWKRSRDVGGTGGLIPYRHVNKIIAAAAERGVNLSGDDFLPKEQGAA